MERRRLILGLAATAVVGTAVVIAGKTYFMHYEHPECPHDPVGADTIYLSGTVALSDSIADVPEFHDCQRFIKPAVANSSAPAEYTEHLFAIFARKHLDLVFEAPTARPGGSATALQAATRNSSLPDVCATFGCTPSRDGISLINFDVIPKITFPPVQLITAGPALGWIAVATIISYGDSYDLLRIKPGVNCVYLRFQKPRVEARIDPQEDSNNGVCPAAISNSLPADTFLQVIATSPPPGLSENDIPAVARWDWDGAQQYIGVRCYHFWCNIGPRGFAPSEPALPTQGFSGTQSRVFRIKGWYDSQVLAISDQNAPGGLRPSQTFGYVVPHPDLETRKMQDYLLPTGQFLEVAYVYVTTNEYKTKMNFTTVQPGITRNVIRARAKSNLLGWLPGLPDYYWTVHIISAEQPGNMKPMTHFRYTRHPDLDRFKLFRTARWRWQKSDETVWYGCPTGCCTCTAPCT